MYATTDKESMAIDAETCRQKWRVREEGPSLGLPINRGAAFLDGRLFRGVGDGDVLAYDASGPETVEHAHRGSGKARGDYGGSDRLERTGLHRHVGSDQYGVTGRVYGLDAQSGKDRVGNVYGTD
jgi:alcohol dehydrogenase (cytochrome c)